MENAKTSEEELLVSLTENRARILTIWINARKRIVDVRVKYACYHGKHSTETFIDISGPKNMTFPVNIGQRRVVHVISATNASIDR